MKNKPPAVQQFFNYGKHADQQRLKFVKWQAHQREREILATTSLKDLIGKKLHVLSAIAVLWLFAHSARAGDLIQAIGFRFAPFESNVFNVTNQPTPNLISGQYVIHPELAWNNPTSQTIYIRKIYMWFRVVDPAAVAIGWVQRRSDSSLLTYVPMGDPYYDLEDYGSNYVQLNAGDTLDFDYWCNSQTPSDFSVFVWYTLTQ